jgi:hypothetical protein
MIRSRSKSGFFRVCARASVAELDPLGRFVRAKPSGRWRDNTRKSVLLLNGESIANDLGLRVRWICSRGPTSHAKGIAGENNPIDRYGFEGAGVDRTALPR